MKLALILLLIPFSLFANSFFKEAELVSGRGKKIELKNGPVLVVNIATQCGYTPQLDELEAVSKKYASKGLTVIGLPSNDFGGQTPEDDVSVADFCKVNYGVTFSLLPKSVVKGDEKIELVKRLTNNADDKGEIKWNFEKFLISKDGKTIKRFRSDVTPDSEKMIKAIEGML